MFTTTKFQNFEIREFEILDSTNLQAKELCNKPINNLVLLAKSQTAGKGRGGKEWFSDEGNLFFSVILDINKIKNFELISLISALTISELTDGLGTKTQIKWPNDVLIFGKKFCGILLEKHQDKLIIGIGINTISSPEYLDGKKQATNLKAANIIVSNQDFLFKFLDRFNINLIEFSKTNFIDFRKKINSKLYKKNEMIELDYLGQKFSGKILQVAENGNLILEINGKEKEFNIGEIL